MSVQEGTPSSRLVLDVYKRLRQEIVTGQLRPNQPIVEADVAQRLGMSRTPVRESLQRLAMDGLVVSQRRRWVVYEHSAEEVRHIYEVRAALEGEAAKLACERITERDLARLKELEPQATSFHMVARDERVAINDQFHRHIAESAHNPRLADMLEQNKLYFFNRQIAAMYSADELAASSRQHEQLVAAIVQRDGERARKIASQHVTDALNQVMDKMF
ncbi:GntR family transcriptional regulator [Nonomuraea sp. K274]|uniref:GntR family transcriptional regulator n=1 Tax=Nonomuraea cypriaca TaxID=1187855 RepID=A0A931EXQ6_9ACTN|nr:GntR family transcriptional regulator [Nonomuraea cypriaca]MBF8184416.1 GntR family transcriptional regulator [Nonomuraea cypriaca]